MTEFPVLRRVFCAAWTALSATLLCEALQAALHTVAGPSRPNEHGQLLGMVEPVRRQAKRNWFSCRQRDLSGSYGALPAVVAASFRKALIGGSQGTPSGGAVGPKLERVGALRNPDSNVSCRPLSGVPFPLMAFRIKWRIVPRLRAINFSQAQAPFCGK